MNYVRKQEMTLYDTGEDYTYTLSVIKTGSDPTLTANAQINVLSQEEVDQMADRIIRIEDGKYQVEG